MPPALTEPEGQQPSFVKCNVSLVGSATAMSIAKTSFAEAPNRSVATTRTLYEAATPDGGVPLNWRVLASNDSQEGSGEPSASVAVKLSASLRSMSVNALSGTV